MEKLNELVALAEKADAVGNLMDAVNPHIILAIAEAFRALEQRAEAAEAKQGELSQQKPIGWLNDAYLGRGVIDGEVGEDDFGPGYIPIYRHPFNDAPVPAAELATDKACDACIHVLSVLGFDHKTARLKNVLAEVRRLRKIEEAR